ncbi:flagellar hook-associated protein FlgK [Aquibacillus sediminis]|uniref:flagellar hook-associated protein FlgK n=1 Tax=Aquibacillus sediminis TaxID=2574734 RepID=UPI0011085383|nr:flagellar hook-associated protein FlgK [Aquibacillus sediminis]
MSTFHGLEVAKRALSTQQSALYTTGHNISNANTEGYTRQRVNFEQTGPFPPASRNRPEIPGQIGSGVKAGSVERVRDAFLDVQYRDENNKLGYHETKADAMKQMEDVMNEPSEQGLSKTMDQFKDALQDLSVNPEDSGARSVVRQRGIAVAETFNYLSGSLEGVREDLKGEIDVTETDMNSLITQINNVNQQIGAVEPHGQLPNDLYDERDRLIDQLSEIADIDVEYTASKGQPSDMAMGKATVSLAGSGTELVNGESDTINHVHVNMNDDNNVDELVFYNPNDLPNGEETPETIADEDKITIDANDFESNGKLKALVEANGYVDGDGNVSGEFPNMLGKLDEMASTFVDEFNKVHKQGANLSGNEPPSFFEIDDASQAAATMKVSQTIIDDADHIAASKNGDAGDGENAQKLADVFTNPEVGIGKNTSIKSYYESTIGEMGVVKQEADRMVENASALKQQVQENRESVSAVSLDEEMSNMIKFQHAYNAAARSMTTIDEMLDRVINNMGLVGR